MSEAKEFANQSRIEQWTAVIRERINSGKQVDEWCAEHGISRNAYYYWHRKIKLATAQEEAVTGTQKTPEIVPLMPPKPIHEINDPETAIVIKTNGIALEIHNSASDAIIERTLKVIKRIC